MSLRFHAPYIHILANLTKPINSDYLLKHISNPLRERRLPLHASRAPDDDRAALPVNVSRVDIKEFISIFSYLSPPFLKITL